MSGFPAYMNNAEVGALLGGLIGLIGGILGFYLSWRSAKTPSERNFMVVFAIILFVLIATVLAIQFTISDTDIKIAAWVTYSLLLIITMIFSIRHYKRISRNIK
jgi:Ca2+/Na+ antiporter